MTQLKYNEDLMFKFFAASASAQDTMCPGEPENPNCAVRVFLGGSCAVCVGGGRNCAVTGGLLGGSGVLGVWGLGAPHEV